ncbi:MAG: cyclic pyranopterin phosphate synthase MoaA [Acidobacteria bacterium RIFCSPLOWO2_12_FULL_54_10]|nr:MAG: cyclic pyranopterin phosphate synthase MoaA [Acidobacteria bacterium RIFCSPLOWO2_12_FULL_54_10]
MPLDQYNREIDYLRISLTDNCNLRCVYCMPINGLKFLPPEHLLTPAEIAAVARAAVSVGFRKFRFTGGEPTLRQDLIDIVSRISAIDGVGDLAMTTNGILLPELARPLAAAGLRRVNIHLDSLHPERLSRIMRWGRVEQIWKGIEAAESAGLTPIKLNAVIAAGYNDHDVVELAALTIQRDWHFRFVEMMPFGNGECSTVARDQYISNLEIRQRIEQRLGPLSPLPGDPSDESQNFRLPGARGVVGFISPVSEPYCDHCNRMRLTADGKFHLCLLNDDEMDIKRQLREHGPDAVREILRKAVHFKPVGHRLSEGHFTRNRSMFQIGG